MKLFREIHRRRMWQVFGIYLAAGWVVIQVVGEMAESLALPDWVQPLAIVLILVGFPIILGTAYIQGGAGRPAFGGRGGAVPFGDPARAPEPAQAAAAAPASAIPEPAPERAHHRLLTWKNAMLGAAGALVLLIVMVGGYVVTRTMGIGPAATLVAQGVIDERDRLLVADFTNRTNDSLLAHVVTEALRVDLARSEVVRLADPGFVSSALQRMARPGDTRLTDDLARELAVREGLPAVVMGEVGSAGSGFVLSAQLVSAGNGEILVSERETAKGADQVLGAIDDLSKKLRERIGESLRILGGEPPLARVTTGDLEALRKYTQAVHAIDVEADTDRGLALLEEAVGIDSAFAMAYRKLGIELNNRDRNLERSQEALTLAYEHRDRLTERERGLTVATYHSAVTGERDRVIQAYENLLQLDPEDSYALNNLGVTYSRARDWDRAADLYLRSVEMDSNSVIGYTNSANVLWAAGRRDESRQILETANERFPHNWMAEGWETNRLYAAGQTDSSLALALHTLEEDIQDTPPLVAGWTTYFAAIAAIRGQLTEAERRYAEAERIQARDVSDADALSTAIEPALLDLLTRGDRSAALQRLDAALARYPLEQIPLPDRPYEAIITVLGWAGESGRATELMAEWEAQADPRSVRLLEPAWDFGRSAIAIGEERWDDAIDAIRRSDVGECLICRAPFLPRAFERAGMADSAVAAYERFIDLDYLFRSNTDEKHLGPTYERLGHLYHEKGDLENAAKYYAMFVELWAEADAELQPRVAAAQARLQEIVEARG